MTEKEVIKMEMEIKLKDNITVHNLYDAGLVGVRVPHLLKIMLQTKAESEGKLLSQYCREVLEEAVNWKELYKKVAEKIKKQMGGGV